MEMETLSGSVTSFELWNATEYIHMPGPYAKAKTAADTDAVVHALGGFILQPIHCTPAFISVQLATIFSLFGKGCWKMPLLRKVSRSRGTPKVWKT